MITLTIALLTNMWPVDGANSYEPDNGTAAMSSWRERALLILTEFAKTPNDDTLIVADD